MKHLSRREFVALTVTSTVASRVASPFGLGSSRAAAAVTAAEIVDRIKKNIGMDWGADGVDTLKIGDPSTVVTGVVTTSMATLDVLQQAVKAGANLIITAQPTFYSKGDAPTPPAGRGFGGARAARGGAPAAPPPAPVTPPPPDPVFQGKNDFIAKNKLVVFRLRDHWKVRTPDPFGEGIGASLGWTRYAVAGDPLRYDVPALTLDALASQVKKALGSRGGIRVIGNPATTVRHIGLLPGTTPLQASLQLLPHVDAVIAGEVREWESATYAQDVVFTGARKGFITVGRVVADEPGMGVCARWLTTIVPEVPIRHLPAGDPYWRPL